jgi:K+-transporting ATPase KdpF subunit
MNFETIIALVLAIAALGYLLYALLRPEELS